MAERDSAKLRNGGAIAVDSNPATPGPKRWSKRLQRGDRELVKAILTEGGGVEALSCKT